MVFWVTACVLLITCLLPVLAALRSSKQRKDAPDVAVYRDQLRELERDAARGTLPEAEAEAARTEVARRLLAADRAAREQAEPAGTGRRWLGGASIVVPVIAVTLGTYLWIGAPGYPDLPLALRKAQIEAARAERPGQAVAQAEVPDNIDTSDPQVTEMVGQLRDILAERPDDLQGWRLAVQTESGLRNFEAAWQAQNRVVAILGDDATGDDFALLAELMIIAAGGYVSPEAEEVLNETLRRDPANGTARYYQGSMFAQGGRPDLAWPIWRRLVAESDPDAPWLEPIYADIERISSLAGDPTPLDQLPRPRGPSAADVDAAAGMTLEERMDMIGGMVEGLASRLASDGGPPEDWARLITAHGVLGQQDRAAAVYAEAKLVFADNPGALDTLFQAAERAGISP